MPEHDNFWRQSYDDWKTNPPPEPTALEEEERLREMAAAVMKYAAANASKMDGWDLIQEHFTEDKIFAILDAADRQKSVVFLEDAILNFALIAKMLHCFRLFQTQPFIVASLEMAKLFADTDPSLARTLRGFLDLGSEFKQAIPDAKDPS